MGNNRFGDWRAGHCGKKRYRSRRRAWAVIIRIWLRERRWDTLQPYSCRWGYRYDLGRVFPEHVHIGHGRYTPGDRARHQLNLRVVWPFYRTRARWRRLLRTLVR